jgi:hypothetical protein
MGHSLGSYSDGVSASRGRKSQEVGSMKAGLAKLGLETYPLIL